MQIKSAVFTTLALATFAAATGTPIPASQCTTGNLQCCNSTGTAKNSAISTLLGLLGIVISDITALVGVTCSPSLTTQPVCCTNNSFNGVVALGCTPVNLNL
ncbi:hypothetical protein BDQ17DRAFT_1395174 [Cyathus striatus]|nr:hypothetical protein BDQ17DRAFT_1395174 [Cyathus striatus]